MSPVVPPTSVITNIGKTEYARFKYNSYNVRFHINDKDTVSTEGNALADVISDRIYSPSYVEGKNGNK